MEKRVRIKGKKYYNNVQKWVAFFFLVEQIMDNRKLSKKRTLTKAKLLEQIFYENQYLYRNLRRHFQGLQSM